MKFVGAGNHKRKSDDKLYAHFLITIFYAAVHKVGIMAADGKSYAFKAGRNVH